MVPSPTFTVSSTFLLGSPRTGTVCAIVGAGAISSDPQRKRGAFLIPSFLQIMRRMRAILPALLVAPYDHVQFHWSDQLDVRFGHGGGRSQALSSAHARNASLA